MRKITKDAVRAFLRFEKFKRDNTKVVVTKSGCAGLYLHNNLIAAHSPDNPGKIQISNAGWPSNTTKERLNGLPNVSIVQKNYVWYLNGVEWDGDWVTV